MNRQQKILVQLRARAAIERRKREGVWSRGGVKAHSEYEGRLLDWVVERLGIPRETLEWSLGAEYEGHRWDGTVDPIARMIDNAGKGRDTAVESATGGGKTFGLACLGLAFLAVYEDSLVVTVAPKKDQLLDQVWMEVGRLWSRFEVWFPDAELLTSGRIRMRPGEDDESAWQMRAFVAGVGADEDSATKAQGFHRESMLIITEETPGIHPAIMRALNETRTDDFNVQVSVGNPDSQFDELHKFSKKPSVDAIRLSALDHPNVVTGRRVIPGAIGAKRLRERTLDLGEGTPMYNSRVRGISPPQSASSLIRWAWLEAAHARWVQAMGEPEGLQGDRAMGVDVSDRDGGDPAGLTRWVGHVMTEAVEVEVGLSKAIRDGSELGAFVVKECQNPEAPVAARNVGVDSVGNGATTVNECRRLGFMVRMLNGSQRVVAGVDKELMWEDTVVDEEGNLQPVGPRVTRSERFQNLRAAAYWQFREDVRQGRIAIPRDDRLWRELTAIQWEPKNGVITVEKKKDLMKRIGSSPNMADAAVYGNWVRVRVPNRRQEQEGSGTRVIAGPNRDVGLEKLLSEREREGRREWQRVMKAIGMRRRAGA